MKYIRRAHAKSAKSNPKIMRKIRKSAFSPPCRPPRHASPPLAHNRRPMELIAQSFDFVLHVDRHLGAFVASYGAWVYALLFLIVFLETGLVVMPFLPGDSLLFITGALAGAGLMDLSLACAVLLAAAMLGDQCNYAIGRRVGPRVFQWENSRFFNRRAFDAAHDFYERYGGITVILARFMPFIRTFAPFVTGVAAMSRRRFTLYNVAGAFIWVISLCLAGYLFGNLPWVKTHLSKIIWAMIILPGAVALLGGWRAARREKAAPEKAASGQPARPVESV